MATQPKKLTNFSKYLIFCEGKVYALTVDRFLVPQRNKDGYSVVRLQGDDGHRYTKRIHRLVAETFIPNPEKKETVNHKDGDKKNNHVSNLEWATRSEQTQHAWDNRLIKDFAKRKQGIRESQGKSVVCTTTGQVFNSIGEAAEILGLKKSNISACCRGKTGFKSAGTLPDGTKLTWRFYEE